MVGYLLLFAVSWIISFFCSGYEIGFLSVNKLKIDALAKRGSKSAKIMQLLLNDKEKVLTTLLVGNMISLVVLTFAFGQVVLSIFSNGFPTVLETVILTALVFTTCELFPKSLFRIYSFELTSKLSIFVFLGYIALFPISWIFMQISQKLSRTQTTVEQDLQLHDVAAEGARRRLLPIGISILMNRLGNKGLRLKDICRNIPRTKQKGRSVLLDLDTSIEEIINRKLLWNNDTIECRSGEGNVFYPTPAIIDAIFRKQT